MLTLPLAAALFVAPLIAAAGAAAISVPIAIHLLSKSRRKQQAWAAMRFLMQAYRKKQRRMKLEQWLLLALRCLIVLVLGLALGGLRPQGLLSVLGLMGGGQSVHWVIDNTLTSAVATQSGTRLDALLEQAVSDAEAASNSDRFWVWPMSAEEALLRGGTKEQAVEALQSLKPVGSARSTQDTLDAVAEQTKSDGGLIRWYSPWSRSNGDLDDPIQPSAALDNLTVVTTRPQPEVANVQVNAARLEQGVYLAEDDSIQIQVSVDLTKSGSAMLAETVPVDLTLWTLPTEQQASQPIGQATVEIRFGAQQRRASGQAVLTADVLSAGLGAWMQVPLVVEARLTETNTPSNALSLDDTVYAVAHARRVVRVGFVDQTSVAVLNGNLGSSEIRPSTWLELALNPVGDANPPMRAESVVFDADPQAALEGLQALVILSPASIRQADWGPIHDWVQAGGVVWLMPPSDPLVSFSQQMVSGLKLPWRLGVAAQARDLNKGLQPDPRSPQTLRRLSPDWPQLLEAVSVQRYWPISEVVDAQETVWIQTTEGEPWHVVAKRGQGAYVWTGSALDTDWTDLPARPLFVPLVQETLRRLVGSSPAPGRGIGWDVSVSIEDQVFPEPSKSIENETKALASGLPGVGAGVYVNNLGVGVDRYEALIAPADAGDTGQVPEALLGRRLDGLSLSGWSYLDAAAGEAELGQASTLTKALLVLLLVLVVLELILSRWFSHAVRHDEAHTTQRLIKFAVNWLHGHGVHKPNLPGRGS